ncbi:NUDIX domain-containing protein [Geomesophilobacter sediminis]|uniref:NUDIX domain-containing protein n=1 Tax=Geomesophilobacter sediminis TaxID=2798584 RepID=A0A8J7JFT3_9BACT|nr:NUDIX domain-containing protein [Geomesophilobacter sediminis]MBJ6725274.1 NUDIX domain-containing protein [Geomesophilobacter sediminis]
MPKQSAGIVLYRFRGGVPQVFLVHPGGPFWKNKDLGAWSIPKGEYLDGEDPLTVARREFQEETGFTVDGPFTRLEPVRQPGGKVVSAWAVEGECDAARITSNLFQMEWPPRSGRSAEFPEVDRADWFTLPEASEKILKGQLGLLDQLQNLLGLPLPSGPPPKEMET